MAFCVVFHLVATIFMRVFSFLDSILLSWLTCIVMFSYYGPVRLPKFVRDMNCWVGRVVVESVALPPSSMISLRRSVSIPDDFLHCIKASFVSELDPVHRV